MKRGAWVHCLLSAYLWLIGWIPLGNWNRQSGGIFATTLLEDRFGAADVGFLLFVSLPGILFWVAHRRKSFWVGVAALTVDFVWLALQIQSWWIPYIVGTNVQWRLKYAQGPTTKLLPSFGHHVAPDGMHLVISMLLVAR